MWCWKKISLPIAQLCLCLMHAIPGLRWSYRSWPMAAFLVLALPTSAPSPQQQVWLPSDRLAWGWTSLPSTRWPGLNSGLLFLVWPPPRHPQQPMMSWMSLLMTMTICLQSRRTKPPPRGAWVAQQAWTWTAPLHCPTQRLNALQILLEVKLPPLWQSKILLRLQAKPLYGVQLLRLPWQLRRKLPLRRNLVLRRKLLLRRKLSLHRKLPLRQKLPLRRKLSLRRKLLLHRLRWPLYQKKLLFRLLWLLSDMFH